MAADARTDEGIVALHPVDGAAGDATGKFELKLPTAKPEVYERVELSLEGVPAATNPFDPESIAVDLEIAAPSWFE